MTALELAEKLKRYKLVSGYATYCHKAADELRRQHEAIKQLREALRGMVALEGEGLRGNDDIDICYEHREALQALKDTEGLV